MEVEKILFLYGKKIWGKGLQCLYHQGQMVNFEYQGLLYTENLPSYYKHWSGTYPCGVSHLVRLLFLLDSFNVGEKKRQSKPLLLCTAGKGRRRKSTFEVCPIDRKILTRWPLQDEGSWGALTHCFLVSSDTDCKERGTFLQRDYYKRYL